MQGNQLLYVEYVWAVMNTGVFVTEIAMFVENTKMNQARSI